MAQHLIAGREESPLALPRNGQILYLEPLEQPQDMAAPKSKGLVEYWGLFAGRKLLIILLGILGACGGFLAALNQTPVYQAHSSLEMQSQSARSPLTGGIEGEDRFSPESFIQTQVKILQSVALRNRTIERLREQNGRRDYVVSDRYAGLRRYTRYPLPPAVTSRFVPPVKLDVKTAGAARVIDIYAQSTDPSLAADYANALSREYLDYTMESRWAQVRRTGKWLGDQLTEQRGKLEASQRRLQDYSRTTGLLYAGKDLDSVDDEPLRRLQEELARAQAERVTRQAAYETAAGVPADSVPQVADNDRLSGYLTRLTELRRELAEISSIWKPEHYRVVRVQAQINEMESTIKRERDSILTRIHNDYESARRREQMLTEAFQARLQSVLASSNQLIQYGILKREVETHRTLYDQLLQKVREVGIGSQMESNTARVLDAAEMPLVPISPNLPAIIALGVMSGLIGAVLLVFLFDHINRRLDAPGETPYYLRVPELGVIPARGAVPTELPLTQESVITVMDLEKSTGPAVELATWRDRPSLMAESFRNALASILLSRGAEGRPRVILITSANRGEGKSTTVTNLGAALAEINHKVVVLDADLRQPHLHEILGVSNSWGLSDLLRETTSLRDCPLEALVRPTEIANLFVLPSGPGTVSIANLLCSSRMTELVNRLRKEFDTLLIDTPPMLYLSDARLLGSLADAAVLVIRARRTTRDDAIAAKDRLTQDGIHVLGTILNDWNLKDKGKYGYQRYGYGDRKPV